MVMSPETDILILGEYRERFQPEIRTAFRHWQCFTIQSPYALRGRNFRRAFYTPRASAHRNWQEIHEVLLCRAAALRSEVLPFYRYVPPTEDDLDIYDPLVSELHRARAHHPTF